MTGSRCDGERQETYTAKGNDKNVTNVEVRNRLTEEEQ